MTRSRPDTSNGVGRPVREALLWAAVLALLMATAILWVVRLGGAL